MYNKFFKKQISDTLNNDLEIGANVTLSSLISNLKTRSTESVTFDVIAKHLQKVANVPVRNVCPFFSLRLSYWFYHILVWTLLLNISGGIMGRKHHDETSPQWISFRCFHSVDSLLCKAGDLGLEDRKYNYC